ncbi:MAG: DUF3093 domain-containing protein [Actinobacteria bacterium]|jgi:hypothetical protein|nr:DUF3093 domain-containing protein [Actinomycetota bacterium]NDB30858.1 DUF3093 domain-containing protein [Actinomycetota bacterium]NDD59715.1 DUF3093 domain-containing protein [Actinomycetota bacterium]
MRERIFWSIGVIFLALAFDGAILLIVASVFDATVSASIALILLFFTLWSWWRTRLEIVVDDQFFSVGRAKIERRFITGARVLEKKEMSLQRTRELNPTAHLALRFWVKTGVKITISDHRDPTPYWLLSSRKSDEIVRALGF